MATTKTPNTGARAAVNAGQGAKKGMDTGPVKPTQGGKSPNVAVPVVRKDPIGGVGKTNPKAQPMYTGKASLPGKTAAQLKKMSQAASGIVKDNGQGVNNTTSDQAGGSGRRLSKDSQKGQ